MPVTEFAPSIITLKPSTVAVLREIVPMSALTPFFGRAFQAVAVVLGQQQITITGPPLAVYLGPPTDSVDVAAGYPSATPVSRAGGVTALTLPGGRAARVVHRGSYDTLSDSYQALADWMDARGVTPADMMWEAYLTEPASQSDPAEWLTEITWPLVEADLATAEQNATS